MENNQENNETVGGGDQGEASKPKKKPFYKKWWFWVIVVLVLVAIGVSGDDPQVPEAVENNQESAEMTETESVEELDESDELEEATELQEYIASTQNDVLPLMQLSNERITSAGELGSQMRIDAAEVQISSAKRFASQAKEEFNKLTPPEEATKLHGLLGQALDKYREAIDVYEIGIAELDADAIYRGSSIYQEGTDFISQAVVEINKLADN